MKLHSKLQISLSKRPGNIVLRRDLAELGSKSQLSEAIRALIGEGRLVRLGTGVYAKSQPDSSGLAHLPASEDVLAHEASTKLGTPVQIVKVADAPGHISYALNKRASPAGTPLPEDVNLLPTRGVREFVERLARNHGVSYRRSGLDVWAESVTRASGDDVRLDATGELLVALKKKKLLNDRQFSRLLTNHTREVKHVRSVRRLRTSRLSPQR
jgi:hypothetical protein